MKNSIIKNRSFYFLTTVILLIVVWFLLSTFIHNEIVFPTLGMIMQSIGKIFVSGDILLVFLLIIKVIGCVAISAIISFLILLLYIWQKQLIGIFEPFLTFVRVVPILGIIIYLFLLFDETITPYIITIFIVVPIIVESLTTAVDNINPNIIDALRLEDINFFQKVFKIYIPMIMPYFLMSLLQSVGLGIKAMIMSEYLCYTQNSIGVILYDVKFSDTSMLIAWLIIIFIVTMLLEFIIKVFKHKNLNN